MPLRRSCLLSEPIVADLPEREAQGSGMPDVGMPDVGMPDLAACHLALVGNAPDAADRAAAIDAADRVVRFNNAPGFAGRMGARTDLLALVNRGGQMREWLDDPGFLDRPAVREARAFLFAFPALSPEAMGTGDGACWTRDALARLAPLGVPIRALPEALHAQARRLLAPVAGGHANPSTGFLVALAILRGRAAGAPPVEVYGYGFSGWPGHPWAAEWRWFAQQAAAGRLRLHAPCPDL